MERQLLPLPRHKYLTLVSCVLYIDLRVKPSLEDGVIEETESANGGGSFALTDTGDDTRVYTIMSRPLPSWALEFVFSPYGPIEEIHLDNDTRMGSVKFSRSDSALRAIQELQNGYDILGQVLHVAGSPLALPV